MRNLGPSYLQDIRLKEVEFSTSTGLEQGSSSIGQWRVL